jgi:hypothetical protein
MYRVPLTKERSQRGINSAMASGLRRVDGKRHIEEEKC